MTYLNNSELLNSPPASIEHAAYVSCANASENCDADRSPLRDQCARLAISPDILGDFERALRAQGFGGDTGYAKLIYLALCTRLFDEDLVSVLVQGPPGAGKSFLVNKVLGFFPEDAYESLSDMSPTAIGYWDADLRHKFLIIQELAGIGGTEGNRLIRTLLTEGFFSRKVTVRSEGGFTVQELYRPGPTGLITTTTHIEIHPEDVTRFLCLTLEGTRSELRLSMDQTALRFSGHEASASASLDDWHAFQQWLAVGERRVVINFAPALASLVPPWALRLNRDLPKVFSLICASALINQENRSRDGLGRISAGIEDYETVYELVADLVSESAEISVPDHVRRVVDAVAQARSTIGTTVTNRQIEEVLNESRSSVSRWVAEATALGFLQNLDPNPGRASRLILGEAMPSGEIAILPHPDTLRTVLTR